MEKRITIGGFFSEGVNLGLQNALAIIVNTLLWALTVWIPYLNVGTTIGLFSGIVAKAGKGNAISMTEIFNPEYRKFMGEYFLALGLMGSGIMMGFFMFVIPGYVIAIAWSQALTLVVDKGMNPTQAITASNKATYGYKWIMFFGYLLLMIALLVVVAILSIIPVIGIVLAALAYIASTCILIGANAYVYKNLCSDL